MIAALTNPALVIEANQVQHVTPEGQSYQMLLADVLKLAQQELLDDCTGVLPSEVCAVFRRGKFTIWVGQFSPGPRAVDWITDDSPSPFGPGTRYSKHSIALPYVLVVAVFLDGTLSSENECFFTTSPLASLSDELCYPALLNISRFPERAKKPLAWICTQHLNFRQIHKERDRQRRMHAGWQLLCECLFCASFNRSSEAHEGASYYELSRHVDGRISTIASWEEATRADPLFILEVPFLKTGHTVEQVVERIFDNLGAVRHDLTADDLARLLVNHKPAPRRPR